MHVNSVKRPRRPIITPGHSQQLRRVTFTCPICDICNKEVDKFEMHRQGDKTVLVAYCHGETSETQPYDEHELDRLYSYRAFMDKRRLSRYGRAVKLPGLNDHDGTLFNMNREMRRRFKK